MKSQTITVYIEAPAERVYAFASKEENMPRWVPSFFRSVTREGEQWVVDSPLGKAVFAFAEKNPFGVLDHRIRLPSGEEFFNPMRVIANGQGCELIFTLFQSAAMSDEDFARDAGMVRSDFEVLRHLMESGADIG
jgi:hypothetical protein